MGNRGVQGFPPPSGNALIGDVAAGKTFSSKAGLGLTGNGSSVVVGNANVGDVLAGQTFTSSPVGSGATGTMPNRGAVTMTPSNASQPILAGYHSGAGNVAAVTVPAGNVLTGTTIAGTAGTMPNQGSPTWTPNTGNQALAAGYYSGGTVNGDANLVAANILTGKSIFGVAGNVTARMYATGSTTSGASTTNFTKYSNTLVPLYTITVSGLSFQPTLIVAWKESGTTDTLSVWMNLNIVIGEIIATNTALSELNGGAVGSSGSVVWNGVNASGFTGMPVGVASATYKWVAYG